MATPLYFDLETIPRPEAELLELMPEELLNPPAPDFSKCPEYRGDTEKQAAWKKKVQEDADLKIIDGKTKFFADSALHAERGQIKLMTLRREGKTTCHIGGVTPEELKTIKAHDRWPCKVDFVYHASETALLHSFRYTVETLETDGHKLVGYYIAGFDIPFALRRCMVQGVSIPKCIKKTPRRFNDALYSDIRDCWTMGDNQVHTGGLAGLCKILGVKRKEGSGEGFWRLWRDNPAAAIEYNLREMDSIVECAERVGAS